jgi:DNA mismatch endonuclease (patch repair protein)
MTDVLSPKQRSHCMSRIRGKDTTPERLVRKGLFALGFRYRLHQRNLPGCPDLVFSKYKAVIFVHGCFWHNHDCELFQWPKANSGFWRNKITTNRANDGRNLTRLKTAGWRILIVWECSIRGKHRVDVPKVIDRVSHWLSSQRRTLEISAPKRRSSMP